MNPLTDWARTTRPVVVGRCECPDRAGPGMAPEWMYEPEELKARIHEPNACPGDYKLARYRRTSTGQVLTLCSACDVPGDEPIKEDL
jgi:hypothetical protein